MHGRYRVAHQGSELVSFALVAGLICGLLLIQFVLSIGVSERDLAQMYKLVGALSSIFPESRAIFEKSYEMAYRAYELQKELSREYSNRVLILLAWARGEVSFPISHLVYGVLSRYVLGYGVIYGLAVKSAWLLVSLPGIAIAIFFWKNKELFAVVIAYFRSKWMDPFGDRRIQRVLRVLMLNPVPASIYHHSPGKYGLLKHSYAVALNAAGRAVKEGLSQEDAFLAGLMHDVGKIKLYRYEETEEVIPDTDLRPSGTVTKKRCGWVSLGTSQDALNRIVMKELKDRFGIEPPRSREIWEIVRKADVEETLKELSRAEFDVDSIIKSVFARLNINDVFGTGKYDGWYSPRWDFVVVLAHAMNRKVTESLLERDPGLPLSPEPGVEGVHTIAYSRPYSKYVLTEVGEKEADDLDLFDVKVGKHTFSAVYLVRKEVVPGDLLRKWGETEFRLEVLERRR